jgi:hypothetical protein
MVDVILLFLRATRRSSAASNHWAKRHQLFLNNCKNGGVNEENAENSNNGDDSCH